MSRVLTVRGSMRPAPSTDVDQLTGSMGDGTSNRPITRSGPRGAIDGDPTETGSMDHTRHDTGRGTDA